MEAEARRFDVMGTGGVEKGALGSGHDGAAAIGWRRCCNFMPSQGLLRHTIITGHGTVVAQAASLIRVRGSSRKNIIHGGSVLSSLAMTAATTRRRHAQHSAEPTAAGVGVRLTKGHHRTRCCCLSETMPC
jgi:hypothetical protein